MPLSIETLPMRGIESGLPRLPLTERTPLTRLEALERRLGGKHRIFIKQDDLGGIGGGGNKLRKLEYAVGAALQQKCDTLITFGALQSNHARLTAAVAARSSLRCELILNKRVPRADVFYERSGNLLLEHIFGARLHVLAAEADPLQYSRVLQNRLVDEGCRPYVIPFGGSDALGAMGYVQCMSELADQAEEQGIVLDHLYHASGSGGTQAGLIVGAALCGLDVQIRGISVLHERTRLAQIVDAIAVGTGRLAGLPEGTLAAAATDDRFVGAGYGIPSSQTLAAIELLARSEGILLDPVYTGKAFAGLVHAAIHDEIPGGNDLVFLHTGGLPGLFAYGSEFAPAGASTST